MISLRKLRRVGAGVIAAALLVAACGSDESSSSDNESGLKSIRFTFAPDPVWDYLNDSGIRESMEEAAGVRILSQTTWDEFGIYAGGFADIVSIGSFETPTMIQESGRDSTIFGKYNLDRSVVAVQADSTAETLADLQGKKVAVWDSVSSTLIWGVIAKQLHDLDFRTGGGDFDLQVVDITNVANVLDEGDVDACLCLPDFGVPQFSSGSIKAIYGERAAWQVYADEIAANPSHEGPMINIFLADTEWYDEHPDEIDFFLALWEAGLEGWAANKAQIIADYPQHFAIEGPAQVQWMTDYLDAHDWFATSVYIDDSWVENESDLFQKMRDSAFMTEDESDPPFATPTP